MICQKLCQNSVLIAITTIRKALIVFSPPHEAFSRPGTLKQLFFSIQHLLNIFNIWNMFTISDFDDLGDFPICFLGDPDLQALFDGFCLSWWKEVTAKPARKKNKTKTKEAGLRCSVGAMVPMVSPTVPMVTKGNQWHCPKRKSHDEITRKKQHIVFQVFVKINEH